MVGKAISFNENDTARQVIEFRYIGNVGKSPIWDSRCEIDKK